MSVGVGIVIDLQELLAKRSSIESILLPPDHSVLDDVGAEIESQTRRRFEEKSSPSGGAWAPWSVAYAASGQGRELLVREGHLRDSIQRLVHED